jgi:hypothetical protein
MSSNAQSQMAAARVAMSKQVKQSQSVVFTVHVELLGAFPAFVHGCASDA